MRVRLDLQQKVQRRIAIAIGMVFVSCMGLRAQAQKKTSNVRKPAPHRTAKKHSSRKPALRHSRHHRRQTSWRTRVHLQPERVKNIQRALAHAGYYHDEPTGEWDDATRQAMQQFQQANGFTPTGLPEAKPLMKLGLGPHPLPPSLDQNLTAHAGAQGSAEPADPPAASAEP